MAQFARLAKTSAASSLPQDVHDPTVAFDMAGRALQIAPPVATQMAQRINLIDAAERGLAQVDPVAVPPDPILVHRLGAGNCLRLGLLPWQRSGDATVILSARPGQMRRHLDMLTGIFGPVRMAHTPEDALHTALLNVAGPALVAEAETRVPAKESCRRDPSRGPVWRKRLPGTILLALLAVALVLFPQATLSGLAIVAMAFLILGQALRVAAAIVSGRSTHSPRVKATPARLPVVSIIVPLYRETGVAAHLMTRLERLDYPRDLLDLCLVLEDNDRLTRHAIDATRLPPWVQVIAVPQGTLRTKPRALNYALNFARGQIIGIYDAEDLPAPDHIHRIVDRFAQRGPDVACLQGVLDYFNSRSNWISRCFTLEYAGWFRVVLPGLAKLGLVVPLGGTTLFLRRHAIEAVAGWDAHNVTEDADLGLRLARHGFRTELIGIVTQEEANARAWPWIRQRTRWLKGYAVTWAVHMRDPVALWRDLGTWRFLGVQLIYLGALVQFALAPLLWSFVLMFAGLPHPFADDWPRAMMLAFVAIFLVAEVANVVVLTVAARRAGKGRLAWWIPFLHAYFPMATVAVYRALWEAVHCPHFWDKTTHGIDPPAITVTVTPLLRPLPRQAADA
jgi:glycosyltransferase XagB